MDKINQVNFFKTKNLQKLNDGFALDNEKANVKSFKNTIVDMMGELNEITNKPDVLTTKVMQGEADVADVMAAIAQAEISVQAATTITGKVLQTYEKIMQIQI